IGRMKSLPAGTGKIVVMKVLLSLLILAMAFSQWDEYSLWLLVPRSFLETNLFARSGMLTPMTGFPAYSTGQSLVFYMASLIVG
ncbi:MAG: hypothetical protein QMC11_02645, partial [Rhodospirillales bacterium]